MSSPRGSFLQLVQRRRSVRRYEDRPVERQKITRCLEAARLAPSASNSQPWSFVVVEEPGLRRALAACARGPLGSFNTFVGRAPVLVAVVRESPKAVTRLGGLIKGRDFALIDTGIAAAHFCLQAAELGLGTCMLGWFDERGVQRVLGVPRGRRVHLLITLGYPLDGLPGPTSRKDLDRIVHYDGYLDARGGKTP